MIEIMKKPPSAQIDHPTDPSSPINADRPTRRSSEGVPGAFEPELLKRIEDLLCENPSIGHAELSRRSGASLNCTKRYRRHIEARAGKALENRTGETLADSRGTLLDTVATRTARLEGLLDDMHARVKASGGEISRNTAETLFRGYSVFERYLRLLDDLHEKLAPPPASQTVVQVQQLLAANNIKLPQQFLDHYRAARARMAATSGAAPDQQLANEAPSGVKSGEDKQGE
jgi:hypothetical protein